MPNDLEKLEQELALLKKQEELKRLEEEDKDLNPHKYFNFYPWQSEFIYQKKHIEQYNRYPHRLYLTCANQVGKSFALMSLAHYICTDKEFRQWHWGNNQPKVIWYVLPTQEHINDFFNEKWEPEVLSRDEAKEKGPHSWRVVKKSGDIKGIYFKETRCTLTFITLSARSSSMQGRTVGAILFDEEPDVAKLAELETRTASFNDSETGLSNAILAFAFTPTSAQDYFKRVFQFQDLEFLSKIPKDLKDRYFLDKLTDTHRTCTIAEEKKETFRRSSTVWKRRVSMFEAQQFEDGSRGKYNDRRIRQFIGDQVSKKDVLVRAFAQFEKDDNGGLLYKYFESNTHIVKADKKDLSRYNKKGILTAGLDYGSGSSHPGGVVIAWINDKKDRVKIIKMWRGEKGKVTTAGDIVEKYLEMTKGMEIDFPFYDYSATDLNTIHLRMTGKELYRAVKNHDIGIGLVDALLQHNMIEILEYDDEPYAQWAKEEFETIDHNTPKTKRTDELTDCIRYALAGVAHLFDLENLVKRDTKAMLQKEIDKMKTPEDYGVRSWSNVKDEENNNNDEIEEELDYWGGFFQ